MPKKVKKSKGFSDNDVKEERAISKVMASANVSKGRAIAILKSKGVLKQKKGKRGLLIKKKKK
jgi:hypothetical protein